MTDFFTFYFIIVAFIFSSSAMSTGLKFIKKVMLPRNRLEMIVLIKPINEELFIFDKKGRGFIYNNFYKVTREITLFDTSFPYDVCKKENKICVFSTNGYCTFFSSDEDFARREKNHQNI